MSAAGTEPNGPPGAFSLAGMHVVVVGASSGLGRAAALRCAEAGASLSVAARREDRLQELVAALPGEGHGSCRLDVRELDSIDAAFEAFVARQGPIHGLVYASGIDALRPLPVIDAEYWANTLDTNLRGAVFCCRAAQKGGRAARAGMSIALISSTAALNPLGSGKVTYAATKAALIGAMRALATEGSKRKIRVNAILAGAIETELWQHVGITDEQKDRVFQRHLLGPGAPDDVAHACVYLLSPAARWITGVSLVVDGGQSLS